MYFDFNLLIRDIIGIVSALKLRNYLTEFIFIYFLGENTWVDLDVCGGFTFRPLVKCTIVYINI